MKKAFKIGNDNNPLNDIKIKDQSVSYDHLEFYWKNDVLFIRDLGSTNGTKKNGVRIRKTTVSKDDVIEIGENVFVGREFMRKVLPFKYQNRVLFYKEFEKLRPIFEEYSKNKLKISGQRKVKIQIFRGLIILALLVVFFVASWKLNIPDSFRSLVTILGGTLGFVLGNKLFDEGHVVDKLSDLRTEYSHLLKCPKCQYDLIGKDYKHWKSLRKCPKCQANWVK